ncbi:MAG: hypothetical protein KAJ67_07275, partial [Gemmatimonadetes bacterium]|nr:hypothetical protein [Gemmatimonadota bacterium]
ASAVTSTITASPTSITADVASTSTVTVQLKDAGGNDLTVGGDAVTLATTLGTLSAPVTDNGDGSYTATLTSATTAGTATVTGTVNTVAIADDATVRFTVGTDTRTIRPGPLLTIIGSGDGDGMVRSEPAGIDCLIADGSADGGDCDENYDDSTWVTLSARPNTGSAFAGWDSACEGTRPCSASIDQDRTIPATQLVAEPAFARERACEGTGSCSASIDQDRTITATFQLVAEPDAEAAAEDLLGRPRLTRIERLFLDQWGNDNYRYDLGDFLALLNRTGQSVSAAIMKQILVLPRDRQNPASNTGPSEPELPESRPDPER